MFIEYRPTEPPPDYLKPDESPPVLRDKLKEVGIDLGLELGKEMGIALVTEALEMQEWESIKAGKRLIEWGKEHPVFGIIGGGAIVVGATYAVDTWVNPAIPELPWVGKYQIEKIPMPRLRAGPLEVGASIKIRNDYVWRAELSSHFWPN
jgi:hypothetical protein